MKITLINCYFGKLPNYFSLWLQSCGSNPKVDFLFVTDSAMDSYDVPENVHVIQTKWEELLRKIEAKFPFKIAIDSPYKLTDFKPAYGYIFEEELADSDYWGYCDIDLVFGDILKFIAPRIEEGYEKIYRLGHLTILENTPEMIHLFKKEGGAFGYTEVFSNKEFYSFDEHAGLMSIARKQGVIEYYREEMADISCRMSRLTVSRNRNYDHQVFYYENGAVYRSYISVDCEITTEEFVYIHLQKRKMNDLPSTKQFYILSHGFVDKNEKGQPDVDYLMQNSEEELRQLQKKEKKSFYLAKLKQFAIASLKEKQIWIKQKQAEKLFEK